MIFDLFETLVTHRDPDFVQPERSIAERVNVGDAAWAELWPVLEDQWERGFIASYGDALTQLCDQVGVEPDKSEFDKLTKEFQGRTVKIFDRVEPSILDMLSRLRQMDLKLELVTNAHNLDTGRWNDCELPPYFDVYVASHEVGLRKPERDIYLLACERLGVDPTEVVFVGDGGSNELRGAEQAGLTPYWWTWFLDQWPDGITPNTIVDGEWRERPRDRGAPYPMVANADELLAEITRLTSG